jgi:hypothetical protein
MSWFEEEVYKYEPVYAVSEPAPVIKYGRLEDLEDDFSEIEVEVTMSPMELRDGSTPTS